MIKINENVANKIEIIDLSSKFFNKNDNIINSLISFSDVFTYVDSYENFSNKNLNEINNLIFYLSVYNKSFNLNNFLYVINKSDLKSENENNENDIDELIGKIKSEKIQFSSFSCKNINLLLDEKNFIENLIEEAKNENIEKNNLLENILKNFEQYNIYKKSIKSLLNSQKENNKENKELEDYIKNLLKNDIKENELENSVNTIIKYFYFVKKIINENPVENSNDLYEKLYSTLFKSKFFLDYEFLITIENICNYLYTSFESIFNKIKKEDINKKNLDDVIKKFSEIFQNEIITKVYNKFLNFKKELFSKPINQDNLNNIINEEKTIIEEIIRVLNNFDYIFNNLKNDLKFNNINIQTNIRLNSYEHGKIKFDNVETQTFLGWLSMYLVKSDNKEIFSLPIYFDSFNNKNNLEEFKENYKIKFELYDIYIKKIINLIYFESKENLIQIFNFKNAKFEEIKNNKYEFMKYYSYLYENFENIINQIELEKIEENKNK